jgi:gamma-glutamylcyclotransferase (GGCT)/AIG2-like uncharacterized protein YtfP
LRRLFVYGTLKTGGEKHYLLDGSSLIGTGVARGFVIQQGEEFPEMRRGDGEVEGEIWDVPDASMPAIDAWEGHPDFYVRTPIVLVDGTHVEVYLKA